MTAMVRLRHPSAPRASSIIAGSNRRQFNCPGVDSKARMLMLRMAERLPRDWEIDVEDLGNVFARAETAQSAQPDGWRDRGKRSRQSSEPPHPSGLAFSSGSI